MKINKSTRHSKITGNFGEALVLYLLSKFGFESANVDHTGIDIISEKLGQTQFLVVIYLITSSSFLHKNLLPPLLKCRNN